MTPRQLRSAIARSNSFVNRTNSYVPGVKGAPLSGQTWREYQRLERIHNRNAQSFYDKVKDLTIPGINQTVEQRAENLSRSLRAGGDFKTFQELNRNARNITGQAGLKDLIAQMRGKTDPAYLDREARRQRRTLRQMLDRIGNDEVADAIRRTSDEDLIVMLDYTDFMKTLESTYAMAKAISSDTPRWQSAVYEDNQDKLQELANWAQAHFGEPEDDRDDDARATGRRTRTGNTRSTSPGRDRFGRFVGSTANPEPTFARDEQGRFTSR